MTIWQIWNTHRNEPWNRIKMQPDEVEICRLYDILKSSDLSRKLVQCFPEIFLDDVTASDSNDEVEDRKLPLDLRRCILNTLDTLKTNKATDGNVKSAIIFAFVDNGRSSGMVTRMFGKHSIRSLSQMFEMMMETQNDIQESAVKCIINEQEAMGILSHIKSKMEGGEYE